MYGIDGGTPQYLLQMSDKLSIEDNIKEALVKRSKLFLYKNVHYYLFAKAGFTKGYADRAKEVENVESVSYEDIVSEM